MCFYLMAMNMLVNPTDICRKLDEGITLISQVDQTHYALSSPTTKIKRAAPMTRHTSCFSEVSNSTQLKPLVLQAKDQLSVPRDADEFVFSNFVRAPRYFQHFVLTD